jgi:hypothetical protein
MTDFAGGKIEAYFGPTELKAPDDLETVICEFIAGAKRSLDIAVQDRLDEDRRGHPRRALARRARSSSSRTT